MQEFNSKKRSAVLEKLERAFYLIFTAKMSISGQQPEYSRGIYAIILYMCISTK